MPVALTQKDKQWNDPDGRPNVVIVGTPFWSQRPDFVPADPLRGFDNVMYSFHFYAVSRRFCIEKKEGRP